MRAAALGALRAPSGGASVRLLFTAAACGSESQESAAAPQEIDVDLTAMSSTIVYSTVNDMLLQPESYLGQTVKMNGAFDEAGRTYCTLRDAALISNEA